MADTTVNASTNASLNLVGLHSKGITWLDTLVGGCVFVNSSNDVVGAKTTDGGVTWSAGTAVQAGTVAGLESFADIRVAGDNGTKIHVAWIDSVANNFRYAAYDISAGTWSTPVNVDGAGDGTAGGTTCFIAKTLAGGFVAGWVSSTNSGAYKSNDGVTWNACASPVEGAAVDYMHGVHVNTDDTKDSGIIFGDVSANEYSIKMYDDSADTWTETAIAASAIATTSAPADMSTRLSDGHTILVFWNATDTATADYLAFDLRLNSIASPTVTALTNILTDSAESGAGGCFIDQAANHIYATYLRGTAFGSTTKVYYKVSTDGGLTWSVETAYSEAAEGPLRTCFGGDMGRNANGGRFQPMFLNSTASDLFVNLVNDVEVSAVVPVVGGGAGAYPVGLRQNNSRVVQLGRAR